MSEKQLNEQTPGFWGVLYIKSMVAIFIVSICILVMVVILRLLIHDNFSDLMAQIVLGGWLIMAIWMSCIAQTIPFPREESAVQS